jgi:hypothetical protein
VCPFGARRLKKCLPPERFFLFYSILVVGH